MGQAEIAKYIEANLETLQINAVFGTKRKLFTELGIPKKVDAKQIETVLKGYVSWEKTGRRNKNHQEMNEIRIIDIINDYHYVDGRIENGGAHNNIYTMQLKPLLLHFDYKDNIMTTKAIAEDIYGFQREEFLNYSEDNGVAFYTAALENKIADITEDSLKSLKNEGLLDYEKVSLIVSAQSYPLPFGVPSNAEVMSNPLIYLNYGTSEEAKPVIDLENQGIKKMLCNSRPWLDDSVFKEIAEDILQKAKKRFSFNTASVVDFLDIVVTYGINIDLLFKDDMPNKPERHEAWPTEATLINGVTSSIREHLKYLPKECKMNPKKKKALYRRTNIFWKLIGWEYTYKAFKIIIKNNNSDIHPKLGGECIELHKNLDEFMIKTVNKKFLVTDSRYNIFQKRKYEIRKYWVAENENVKKRHCAIFVRSMDEQIFRDDIYEEVDVTGEVA